MNTELFARLHQPNGTGGDPSEVQFLEFSTYLDDMEERALNAETDLVMKEAELAGLQARLNSYGERPPNIEQVENRGKDLQDAVTEILPTNKATEQLLEELRERVRRTFDEQGIEGVRAWLSTTTSPPTGSSKDERRRSETSASALEGSGVPNSDQQDSTLFGSGSAPWNSSVENVSVVTSRTPATTRYSSLERQGSRLLVIPEEQGEPVKKPPINELEPRNENDDSDQQPREPYRVPSLVQASQSQISLPRPAVTGAESDPNLYTIVPASGDGQSHADSQRTSRAGSSTWIRQGSRSEAGSASSPSPTPRRQRSVHFEDENKVDGDYSSWVWWLAMLIVMMAIMIAAAADTERRQWIAANQSTSSMFYAMRTRSEKAKLFRWLFGWAFKNPYEGVMMGLYG